MSLAGDEYIFNIHTVAHEVGKKYCFFFLPLPNMSL